MTPTDATRLPREIILASGNSHKASELSALLRGFPVVSAGDRGGMPAVAETEKTFRGNAYLKAMALRRMASAEVWILADDSGLEVDALNGRPGVHSARFAGEGATDEENRAKLLRELVETPVGSRAGRFRCVLCLLEGSGNVSYFDGSCEGEIAVHAGGCGGFGYDPVFVPLGYEKTFGELPAEVKEQISHRALAAGELAHYLGKFMRNPGGSD